jgi:hypothetical protein
LIERGALAIAIWWSVGLVLAFGLFSTRSVPRPAMLAGGLLALLTLLTLLSIAWSESAELAFNEFNRASLYLGAFALVVLLARPGDGSRWADGLAAGIALAGLLALASRLFGDAIGSVQTEPFLPGVTTRLSYPVGYWNGLGIFVGLSFPLLLRAATEARAPLARALALAPLPALAAVLYLTSSRGGVATALIGTLVFVALTPRRPAALVAALLGVLASALVVALLLARDSLVDGPLGSDAALSQGEGAALLIALLCMGVAVTWGLGSRFLIGLTPRLGRRGAIVAVAVVALLAVAVAVAADAGQRFDDFKRSPAEVAQPSQSDFTRQHLLSGAGNGRWQFWGAAVDQFQEHPLSGDGAGSYEAWWAEHADFTYFIRDAHSLYLEMLGELGLIGFALLLGLFAVVGTAATRRLIASSGTERATIAALIALLSAFAVAAAIDWMWELTVVALMAITAIALLTGRATEDADAATPPAGESAALPLWPRVAAACACLGLVVAAAIPLLAQREIDKSERAAGRGDLTSALDAADRARAIQPWAATPRMQLALVYEQQGDLAAARSAIGSAIARNRSDWRLWLVSARIEARAGNVASARRSLERARALNPMSPALG